MRFYDRENELNILKETDLLSKKVGGQFLVLSGRRRVGKSELIKKYFKNKDSIYFFVSRKKSQNLLEEFSLQFNLYTGSQSYYKDWDNFIEDLLKYSCKENISIIFDEFQEFTNVDSSVYSIFQKTWDKYQHEKGLNIVVSGSYISLIEKIFYSQKEPLYGRSTRKIVLKEFNFNTVRKILTDYRGNVTTLELLFFYTVFGGNPYYYVLMEKGGLFLKDFYQVVDQLILKTFGTLHNEGREILIKEFGNEHLSYFSILSGIAKGYTTFTSLESYTQIDSGNLLRMLKQLQENFLLIEKEKPIFPNNSKINRYSIKNNFILFWFKYVFSNESLLGLDRSDVVLKRVKDEIKTLSGYTFEKYVLEYILEQDIFDEIKNIGSWWDKKGEIDIVIDNTKEVIFIECKMNPSKINKEEINKFISTCERLDSIKRRDKKYYFAVLGEVDTAKRTLLQEHSIDVITVP